MTQVLDVSAHAAAGARELGAVIAQDQSLTAKLLKVANSAFYSPRGSVANVRDAVVRLGFDQVKNLALGISVVGMFERGTQRGEHRVRTWTHALNTAVLAELLDRERGRRAERAFTAGLLHDLGQVILDQYFPEVHRALHENARATGRTPAEVEAELLGCTHAHVGFWVAERWRFPDDVSEAIRFHHLPGCSLGDAGALTALVHVADALVNNVRPDADEAEPNRVIDPEALTVLKLDSGALVRYHPAVTQARELAAALVRSLMHIED